MLAEERRQQILSLLKERGYARTMDLARRFNVSDQTIRRDLQELAALGHVSKSHGGGSLINWDGAPFSDRTLVNRQEKLAIAKAAAGYVQPGMTVVVGPGTTAEAVATLLDGMAIRLVTNSMAVARTVASPETEVWLTGGRYRSDAELTVGDWTELNLDRLFADVSFVGVSGVDIDTGYTVTEEDEALALRHCIRVAKKAVVVADSAKFERVAKASVAPLAAVHVLVSDERLSGDWRMRLEANGVEVVTAAVR
ncbi:MAG TPA: DeoR/GlpR family DNA-binding transcription regulator [Trueperaceae bacterium]|nr:DeoR/GlpR family DNA-binding transcription regulator [Trueperaceae bacterium]